MRRCASTSRWRTSSASSAASWSSRPSTATTTASPSTSCGRRGTGAGPSSVSTTTSPTRFSTSITTSGYGRSGSTCSPGPMSRPRTSSPTSAASPPGHARAGGTSSSTHRVGSCVTCSRSFAQLEHTFVVDHMGYMKEEEGLSPADVDRLLAVFGGNENCWIKLSGPYRIAKDKPLSTVTELGRALVATCADRLLWGSDWPHLPDGQRDTGELLNLLADWAPDPVGSSPDPRGVGRHALLELKPLHTGGSEQFHERRSGPREESPMAYYRQVGEIPPKRHTQFRRPDGGLYCEELMGEEGFSSDSSLLYHRGIPSAMVDARAVGAARPDADPERAVGAAAPEAARPVRRRGAQGRRPGHRTAAGARQRRRPDLLRRVAADLAVLPQRHRRRVRLRRARRGDGGDGVRRADRRPGRLRDPAAGHHAPVGPDRRRSRCAPTSSRPTATSPRPSATCPGTGSCWSTRPTASGTCAARPSRCSARAPTSRCTSSTAATARAGWPAAST